MGFKPKTKLSIDPFPLDIVAVFSSLTHNHTNQVKSYLGEHKVVM